MDLWVVFLTGLTIGGLTCLALQGGLLASVIASQNTISTEKKSHFLPTTTFLVSKLFAHILLGFGLGFFGQTISLSDGVRAFIQILAGVYMIAIALNLLKVHPIFRYVVIQPPKSLFKLIRKESKSSDFFAPALLGFLTIFIPCGTTLAMEALAISTGNPFAGAAVMAAFVLGTSPYFLGVGFLTSKFGDLNHSKFIKLAAVAIIYLAITNINGSLIILNSPVTLQTLAEKIPIEITIGDEAANQADVGKLVDGVQTFDIEVTSGGYYPRYIKAKQNQKVRLNLNSIDAYSCALAFRIPAFKIAKNLAPNGTDFVEFTPTQKGRIAYTCSMGMYRGVVEVI